MSQLKLFVLDMAGTTVDEDNIVYKTLRKAVVDQGVEVDLDTVLKYCAGKEKHTAIKDLLNELQIKNVDSNIVFENFKIELETAYDIYDVKPISGVETLFVKLKERGIKVVLNTGYDSKTANKLISKLNWKVGSDIDGLVTADDVVNGRPGPDMIFKAMSMFSITDSKEVLKAGDSVIDIQEGKNAQCGVTIGVLSGAQKEEELKEANPDFILNNISQVFEYLPQLVTIN